MGSLAWKVLGTASAVLAGVLARKVVTAGWKAGTGKEPPANPQDPQVSWQEALGWAVFSGAVIGVARLVATRKAAQYYTKSAGHPPRGMNQVS